MKYSRIAGCWFSMRVIFGIYVVWNIMPSWLWAELFDDLFCWRDCGSAKFILRYDLAGGPYSELFGRVSGITFLLKKACFLISIRSMRLLVFALKIEATKSLASGEICTLAGHW